MNQLEQLTKLQRKQEESQPFSENDKKILKQLSQCNSSYYKAKIIDMLIYELEDWSYEILKVMVKDQDRLVAEMAVRSLALPVFPGMDRKSCWSPLQVFRSLPREAA